MHSPLGYTRMKPSMFSYLGRHRRGVYLTAILTVLLAMTQLVANATIIGQSNFNMWWTCSTLPYLIGSTGMCVPVGGSECNSNFIAGQEKYSQTANGMQFYGCFKGAANAPDGSNEEAVFVADDVVHWTGHEMGFVKTLHDNVLKAYLQGNGKTVFGVISSNDNGYHTYKCYVDPNDHTTVNYTVDGVWKLSLHNGTENYWSRSYCFVGNTHRTSTGWNATGQQIEMYDMQYF